MDVTTWYAQQTSSQIRTLRSIRKGSSLCPNHLQRAYSPEWELRRVEGCRGPNRFLKRPSETSSHAHTEVPSSRIESAQRIMGARSDHQLYPSKWLVLSISFWNEPSIWRPRLFSLQSALRRAIYPVWNVPVMRIIYNYILLCCQQQEALRSAEIKASSTK